MKQNWFLYKLEPFRPLYLGGYFNVPHKRSRLWLFGDQAIAKRLAFMNGCDYADFRDYIRICQTGLAPVGRSTKPSRTNHKTNHKTNHRANHQPTSLKDLA